MKKTTLLLISLTALGCAKSESPKKGTNAAATGDISIPHSLIGNAEADPSEVLVEVNGKKLTRGEAMRQAGLRLGGPPPADMPAGRVAMVRSRVLSQVVDQFVKRTLLLAEAERQGIAATEAEIQKGLDMIKSKAPDGQMPQVIVQDGPAGSDTLRNEVVIGIKIDKLLANTLPPLDAPSEADIDSFIEQNRKSLTHPEKGLVPREQVIKMLEGRARHEAIAAYVRGLQEVAEIRHAANVQPPKYSDDEE